jgi:hypothetical protein
VKVKSYFVSARFEVFMAVRIQEVGGSKILLNTGVLPQRYTALQSRRPQFETLPNFSKTVHCAKDKYMTLDV